MHRYLYAYSNPTLFVDPNGNEATAYFNAPIDSNTLQIPTFGTYDTGSDLADAALATSGSLLNVPIAFGNAILNTASLPLRGVAALAGTDVDTVDQNIMSAIASSGHPALIEGGTLAYTPFRATSYLNRLSKGGDKLQELNRQTRQAQRNSSSSDSVDDIPVFDNSVVQDKSRTSLSETVEQPNLAGGNVQNKVDTQSAAPQVDKRFQRRPGWRKSTDVDARARATDPDGTMRCIKCDKPLTGEKQSNGKRDYQLGHPEDSPWVKQQDEWKEKSEQGESFTRKDVIEKYQEDIEVECVQCNASDGAKIGRERKRAKDSDEGDG